MPTTYAIPDGRTVMAATLYTGNATARTIANTVNGISFQPDLVWLKMRSSGSYLNHHLVDSVRGDGKVLYSNLTNAEDNLGSTVIYTTSTGFGLSAGVGVNENSQSLVGWQWNAGGSTVTNTDGTISAQVRANTTAGFSVVTYTGNGLTNQSVGHGLNATPGMVIIKQRDGTASWLVHHQSQPTGYTLYLNLTNAQDSGTSQWGTSAQTSSLFYVGYTAGATGSNVNASTYVAYCFAPVDGYSAFGSYIGNGSANGPFVYTGFRPKFVMTKRTDSTGGWVMLDSARDSYNVSGNILQAESSAAELAVASYPTLDILSNGFKMRSSTIQNASGGTYIYAAFAENPFKYANAR